MITNNTTKQLVLKQQYITPNDVDLPQYRNKSKKQQHQGASLVFEVPSVKTISNANVRTELDGFYLLERTGMGFPEDAQMAELADKKLTSVVADDLTFFSELLYIDVSENFLTLDPFGAFPKLRELRIACNHMTNISSDLCGFEHLMYLDLSYNRLTPAAVQNLEVLPSLRELDLCGNDLRVLPEEMFRFAQLEKLLLEYNRMEDNSVFHVLAGMPNLRQVSLANNFLSCVPPDSCSDNGLRLLESLDVSFNYFSSESSVEPVISLPRLLTVTLYGNPVLGPTGEDPLYVYIEGLVERAGDIRDATRSSLKDIEFLTEIPRKRTLKKGQALGRQAMYRDFAVVQVDDSTSSRTTKEWRQRGAQTIFAEAMQNQRKQLFTPAAYTPNASVIPDLTFLTSVAGLNTVSGHESAASAVRETDAIADGVMRQVAAELGILNSAELLRLRERVRVAPNASQRKDRATNSAQAVDRKRPTSSGGTDGDHSEEPLFTSTDADEAAYLEAHHLNALEVAEEVPQSLFAHRQISDPIAMNAQPVALKTAMKALQLALKQPLTDYSEVPSRSLHSKEYVRPTASSKARQIPRHPLTVATSGANQDIGEESSISAVDRKSNKYTKRGLSEPLGLQQLRQEQRDYTLGQIDQVLDSLNENALAQFQSGRKGGVGGGMMAMSGQVEQQHGIDSVQVAESHAASAAQMKETMSSMRYFARPYAGVKGLMAMVDEVESEFNK